MQFFSLLSPGLLLTFSFALLDTVFLLLPPHMKLNTPSSSPGLSAKYMIKYCIYYIYLSSLGLLGLHPYFP